jgi:hypothetical protein
MYLTIKNYKRLEEVDSNITINEYINGYNINFYAKLLNDNVVIEDIHIKFEIMRNGSCEDRYEVHIKFNTEIIGYLKIGMDVLESLESIKEWIYSIGKKIIEKRMSIIEYWRYKK